MSMPTNSPSEPQCPCCGLRTENLMPCPCGPACEIRVCYICGQETQKTINRFIITTLEDLS